MLTMIWEILNMKITGNENIVYLLNFVCEIILSELIFGGF